MQRDVEQFNQVLAAALLESGVTGQTEIDRAASASSRTGERLDRTLLALGLAEETRLLPVVCDVLGVPYLSDFDGGRPDEDAIAKLTRTYVKQQGIYPVLDSLGQRLVVMADPAHEELRRELAFLLDAEPAFVGAPAAVVRQILQKLEDPAEPDVRTPPLESLRDAEAIRRSSLDGPVVRFIQDALSDAVLGGASDLHYEATDTGYALRFRVNGILRPYASDPQLPAAAVAARLKVLANVNVAETRLPQDGRFEAMIAGRRIDFRLSSLPTQWGESVVCRVLDPKALRLGWSALGFTAELEDRIKALLARPHGLFLVTGPTGSGKTTTLYTAVSHLNHPGRKIVTVEDPVEYNITGVQQIQVHDGIGLTFGRTLRSILRHDPNVILIGEIRDQETAEIAIRAAQVGRLVLSTLHTNSASGARARLVDLGVPEFLVRDVVIGVLGQELVPVACASCAGAGCKHCSGQGVSGRRLEADLWMPQ